VVGEDLTVSATVFREGHDAVAANVAVTRPDGTALPFTRLVPGAPGTDRWSAEVALDAEGMWTWVVEAWDDPLGTWWHDAPLKVDAGVDVDVMLEEGARLYAEASKSLPKQLTKADRLRVSGVADVLRDAARTPAERMTAATDPELVALLTAHPLRRLVTRSATRQTWVDRTQALYGAWYEFFPRSEGAAPDADGVLRSGTFRTAMERLPAVAGMGFDVVYLPPIHPVGKVNRKGPNSAQYPAGTRRRRRHDPGSPWAIGSDEGGHDAVHPDLGTIEDFDAFVARTASSAWRSRSTSPCSALRPPVGHEHPSGSPPGRRDDRLRGEPAEEVPGHLPDQLRQRPRGPLRRGAARRAALDRRTASASSASTTRTPSRCRSGSGSSPRSRAPSRRAVPRRGVHPAGDDARPGPGRLHPVVHVLHLADRQGRARGVRARAGRGRRLHAAELLRQHPGHPARVAAVRRPAVFKIRAVLAALLSPTYGVYAGYELYEHVAVKPGSEEYLDSEKYQYRPRDWSSPEKTLTPYLTMLNEFRRAHPATHRLRNLHVHQVDSPDVMCWSKQTGDDVVVVVVNLDPHGARESTVHLDMPRWAWTGTTSSRSPTPSPAPSTSGARTTTSGSTRSPSLPTSSR
jgi:starch synthase (maltosyl-transferring)